MRRLAYVYIIIFPYMFLLTLGKWLTGSETKVEMILKGLVLVAQLLLIVVAVIVANISAVTRLSLSEAARWTIWMKVGHLPFHLLCLVAVGGMMNPWLFFVSWIPFVFSGAVIAIAGAANVGVCLKAYGEGRMSLRGAIVFGVLAFVYFVDFFAAVVQSVVVRRKK